MAMGSLDISTVTLIPERLIMTQKAEMPSLKPTPKQQKGLKDEGAKESVQLKSTLKHEVCHSY